MYQSKKGYSVLIIEDNPPDQILLEENLKNTGLLIDHITAADTIKGAMDLLEQYSFSIIFLDLFLPDSSGLETVTQLVKLHSKTPVIITSGLSDTQTAVTAISMGAQEFLIKGEYTSVVLEKAVRYSIERKDAEQLIKTSEESYRYLFDNNPAAIFIWNLDDFRILEVNEAAVNLYGYTRDEFLQKTLMDIRSVNDREKLLKGRDKLLTENRNASGISKHFNKKGEILNMDTSSHRIVYHTKQAVLTLANDVTERVLLEEKLTEEKIKKEQEIAAAVLTAQAQERTFLAEELHDNINQILATASLYMDCAIADEDSRINFIKDSKKFVKDAMEEIRKLSKTLLPASLGEVGLQEALNDLIEKIKRVNDSIHFSTNWQIPNESILSEKLKLNIFRIVQEQLNNIFKHAKASNISISLKHIKEVLQLRVKDNGVGFDTSQKRDGVGLQNIFERTDLLKGTATINSQPGAGCELIINFICKNSTPDAVEIVALDHTREKAMKKQVPGTMYNGQTVNFEP
jgi:two-component system, NarL family, sensor histidine kinase UhpB